MSPSLDIYHVTVATISWNAIRIPFSIAAGTDKKIVETTALIDSGAGGQFIDQNFAKNFEVKKLEKPLKAYNVDGTENKQGTIKNYVDLKFKIGTKTFTEQFMVTGLGKQKVILGFTWLNKHNPDINWKTGRINWKQCDSERIKQIIEKS